MTYGAWIDGASLWTLALELAGFVTMLATLLFVAERNTRTPTGV